MYNSISPLRPNSREETKTQKDEAKPNKPPANDNFRKLKDARPEKHDEEMASAVEEKDDAPSLFDLSKSGKDKKPSGSAGKSSVKDGSGKEIKSAPPSTSKQDLTQDSDSNEAPAFEEEPSGMMEYEGMELTNEYETNVPIAPAPAKANEPQPMPGNPQVKTPQKTIAQPMDLLKQQPAAAAVLGAQQKIKVSGEKNLSEAGKTGQDLKKQKSEKSDKSKGENKAESKSQTEAAAAASGFSTVSLQSEKAADIQEPLPPSTIREIADQIVDRIQVLRQGNETKTTITLRSPPILEGATITLTTTDTAKRECNIAFANLSPDAKMLLDRKLKEDSLTQNLERKGITVHMLTTTTQAEQPISAQSGQSFRERQQEQQQQQQQQQGKGGRQNRQGADEEEST